MFLIQEIPSVQTGFAFAVELFFIVFFLLCWLFYVPTQTRKEKQSIDTTKDPLNLTLTQEVIDEFYDLLTPEKVKFWGLEVNENVISVTNDFNFCPFVEYLLQSGIYESVDINCNDHASFWTTKEINNLSDTQLDDLDEIEKHCLDLPPWVSQAIDLFDELLKERQVIGLDVVNIVNQVTGVQEQSAT